MRIERDKAVFLLIDVQEKLYPHMENKEALLSKTVTLLSGLAALEVPALAARQHPQGLGDTIEQLRPYFEGYYDKKDFSCCSHEGLMATVAEAGRNQVIIAGIEAHICVLQTAIDLKAIGFQPVVVTDAISSRSRQDYDIALRRMEQEGVLLATVESILFELCRVSGTAQFKAISRLVK